MKILFVMTAGLLVLSHPVLAHAECNPLLKPSTPDSRFVPLDNDSTVLDTATGLVWMRCNYGSQWNDGHCEDDPGQPNQLNWADALRVAAEVNFDGHNTWRLPNKIELDSIVERQCSSPALNQRIFPTVPAIEPSEPTGTLSNYFWTNTPNQFNSNSAWAVEFTNGAHVSTGRHNEFMVRMVREYRQNH